MEVLYGQLAVTCKSCTITGHGRCVDMLHIEEKLQKKMNYTKAYYYDEARATVGIYFNYGIEMIQFICKYAAYTYQSVTQN